MIQMIWYLKYLCISSLFIDIPLRFNQVGSIGISNNRMMKTLLFNLFVLEMSVVFEVIDFSSHIVQGLLNNQTLLPLRDDELH
jgi:hypothetical protein